MGYPRIRFNGIDFDMQAYPNSFVHINDRDFAESRSTSGIVERLEYFDINRIKLGRNFFENADIEQIRAFFDYASAGASFEFWRDSEFGDALSFENSLTTINEKAVSTFARASAGYRLNPATGFYESIATNLPRYIAGKHGYGLLLEKAGTNRCQQSDAFNTSWIAASCTVTSNVATVKDIYGTTTADLLAISITGGGVVLTTGYTPPTSTTKLCFSIFLRTASGTAEMLMIIGQNAAVIASTNITVTSEWQRFTLTVSAGLSTSFAVAIGVASNGGAMNVYASSAQLETALYATAPIPTAGSEVTRSADRAEWTATDFLDVVNEKVTVAFWVNPLFPINDATSPYFFVIDGAVAATYCILLGLNVSGNWSLSCRDIGNSEHVAAGSSASALIQNQWNRVVAVIDTTVTNGLKIYCNGVLVQNSSVSPFALSPLSGTPKIAIGGDTGSTCTGPGIYDDFRIDKTAWTANQVAEDYNSRDNAQARRNYWPALRLRQPNFQPQERIGSNLFGMELELEEVIS